MWSTTSAKAALSSRIGSFFTGSKKSREVTQKSTDTPKRPWFFVRILRFFWHPIIRYSILTLIVAFVALIAYIAKDLPSPSRITHSDNYAVSTIIYDRNGTPLYEIFADENRTPISISSLPPHVYQASIAIEDKNFYSHFGIDVQGVARAAYNNFKGERIEGGSTITQQLVKNALLTNERTLTRKAKEAVLAVITEAVYSKEEILEMYLNYISYGGTSVGIEAASKAYFDKPASQLSLAEAALLAGLPQSPSKYSPFASSGEAAKARQKEVLRRMTEDGYITQEQADAAEKEVLTFAISKTDIEAPHFVFYVRDLLVEQYGVETVEKGGLRVTTSLDLNLHKVAQASLSAEVAKLGRYRVSNAAALVIKPDTGEILSMIGSKDYFNSTDSGQVNVTLAERQPGSSIKPIMYAITFQEKTLNPGTLLLDTPTCFTVPGQAPYCPKNYDGTFKGPISIRKSLGNSLNIPAVKALRTIGVPKFIEHANNMGITSWQDPNRYGLSLTLGGGEVKMIDLAQAFTVVSNQGVKVPLAPILKVEDHRGSTIYELNIEQRKKDLAFLTEYDGEASVGDLTRVMDRAPAYLTAHIMQDNTARMMAFGPRSELVIPGQVVSAKTGTTNNLKDNWTVGFTPEFLVITWVGNNDGTPMNQNLVSGVTGAAPIFNDIMSLLLKDREPKWPEKPPDVLSAKVCAHGMPPQRGEQCGNTEVELYWASGLPSRAKFIKKSVWINPATGLPPNPGEPTDGLVLQEKMIYQDPVTDTYCSDCARPVDGEGRVQYERVTVPHDYVPQDTFDEEEPAQEQ